MQRKRVQNVHDGGVTWSSDLRQMSQIYSYGNKFCTTFGDKFAKPTKRVIQVSQDLEIDFRADLVTDLMTNTLL